MKISKPKILTIITTFNPNDELYSLSFKVFKQHWFKTIDSWLSQKEVNLTLIVADTISGPLSRERLKI
ncbi:MAG: hypothetical protein AABY10_05220, partial [Nanoarchaeota archaeon]